MANEKDSFFLSSMVVIPTSPTEDSESTEAEDPRIPHQFCWNKHEKTKKFLSSNVTSHKLISSSFPEYNYSSTNLKKAHNIELISNPRNSIFFSLHGPEYNKIVKYFDPRLTKSCDILGQKIFGDQAFIDVNEEIPATNDIIFENLVQPFCHEGPLHLTPLQLDGIEKDEGECTKSFHIDSDNGPDTSESDSEIVVDEKESYQNLLIDILFSKGSQAIQSKLKSFEKIKKYFEVPNPKINQVGDPSKIVVAPESPMNSFVLERSLSAPQQDTPVKHPVKQTKLTRLASDPNSSFIADINNRSCVTSTPDTKKREKRKSAEAPVEEPLSQSRRRSVEAPVEEPLSPVVPNLPKRTKIDEKNRSCLLDVGLKTIRELKGTDSPLAVVKEVPAQQPEPDSPPLTHAHIRASRDLVLDSQLTRLDVKDRGIGRWLARHCSCWVEDKKHERCVEGYGEFVVSVNNRYGHQIQLDILTKALTILAHIPFGSQNVILRLSLFTAELLKILETWEA